jgi:leader peptidase (prepilin peptidase)/N-methyltransferase
VLNQIAIPLPLLIAGAFFLGLLVGSFLNVVIHRLPRQLEHEWRCQCEELLSLDGPAETTRPPGIVHPPSSCPHCGHRIRAHENIPVLSYLLLRGKCSACKTPISPRYPIVEFLTATAFALVAFKLGPTVQCLAALLLTSVLIALSGIDFDHQLLPDNLTLSLLWCGLLLSLFGVFTDPVSSIIGAACGYLFLWAVYHLFRIITGKEGMGHGDFKLMGALGAWFGWQVLPVIILVSSLVGAVIGLILIGTGLQKKEQPIPFGPFIAAAGWITMLWGESLLNAYLGFSGL